MQNPQSFSCCMTPRQIHSYDLHTNIPWNMKQYEIPALHFDQKAIIKQRQYAAQKKGVKNNDYYLTKKGFYMDYDLKVAKDIPSPVKYQKNQPWDSTKHILTKQQVAEVRKSIKFNYLEKIQMQQNKMPSPGIGKYNLTKSMQQIKQQNDKLKTKKIQQGQRRYFLQDTYHLSNTTPGMGTYNPHFSVDHLKASKTDFKYWKQKHAKLDKINTSRQLIKPNPASYSPTYQQFNTFQRTFSLPKKIKTKKNGFGSDARFPYVRENKKVIIQKRPAPSAYETKIQWRAKDNVSPKKKLWNQIIYKGSPPKVYH